MNLKLIILHLVFSCSVCALQAQTGIIKGNVKDAKSNDAMIGATVMIDGTQLGTITDFDGNFVIPEVKAGVCKVIISSIGYANTEIEYVRVEAYKSTIINSSLIESSQIIEGVEVTAQRKTGSDVSVVSEIRQLANIAVGVSSQQITKTQDRDASQVVRRVPGVSIFDDRFIVVRGLNERYNTVLLNDIITPSTEVDEVILI
ncbi:MAG: carboxypeptidase-like regulatory domain-containing protein [Saprospiraceae bacterium]|nr:carboxypeptidase-like regulatory domain-containing protein [Saprospiraceae bacterium]